MILNWHRSSKRLFTSVIAQTQKSDEGSRRERTFLAKLLLSALIVLGNGSCGNQKTVDSINDTEDLFKDSTDHSGYTLDDKFDILHNHTSVSLDGCQVEIWNQGRARFLGSPINIVVRVSGNRVGKARMLEATLCLRIKEVGGGLACQNSRVATLLPVMIQGKEYLGALIEERFLIPGTGGDYLVMHEGKYLLDVDVTLENGLVFSSHTKPIQMFDRAKAFANDRKK